ncbi:MAG: Gfo/Idh/MocA family oxidoreductase, partial [Clostridia bacterium]|nr:Gfo/Idh/MocA family oxidoreductase [Clostridia bacterium]
MKLGMIGYGHIGRAHYYAVRNLPIFFPDADPRVFSEYSAVVSSTPESTLRASRAMSCDPEASDVSLISRADVEAVDICTPNALHYSEAKSALELGKPVYCEKPLTLTFHEADELRKLSEEKNIPCGVAFNYRFLPGSMRAREIVSGGRIGRIISCSFRYLHASAAAAAPRGWKSDPLLCGGGALPDLGSHVIDLCRYVCGEDLTDLSGRAWYRDADNGIDDAFFITAGLSGGGVAFFEANRAAFGTNDDLSFEIYGSKGALSYSMMQPNYLRFYDGERCDGVLGGDSGFTLVDCIGKYPAPGGVFPSQKAPVGWPMTHVNSMFAF